MTIMTDKEKKTIVEQKREKIGELWKKVNRFEKHKVIRKIDKLVPQSFNSIQKNWLNPSSNFHVHEAYLDLVIEEIDDWIANQNKVKV